MFDSLMQARWCWEFVDRLDAFKGENFSNCLCRSPAPGLGAESVCSVVVRWSRLPRDTVWFWLDAMLP